MLVEYAYSRTTSLRFEKTTEAVEAEAGVHGFVVSRIYDMHDALAAKGFDIAPLRIYVLEDTASRSAEGRLGLDALAADLDCKVYVHAEMNGSLVAALRPTAVCGAVGDDASSAIEEAAGARVVALVDAVAATH